MDHRSEGWTDRLLLRVLSGRFVRLRRVMSNGGIELIIVQSNHPIIQSSNHPIIQSCLPHSDFLDATLLTSRQTLRPPYSVTSITSQPQLSTPTHCHIKTPDTHMHTYIHTYIHTYTHIYMHTPTAISNHNSPPTLHIHPHTHPIYFRYLNQR